MTQSMPVSPAGAFAGNLQRSTPSMRRVAAWSTALCLHAVALAVLLAPSLPLDLPLPPQARSMVVVEVLRQVEMDDKWKNRATDLSGGQKQRSVIARALANRPQLIFADEPTGNLDSATGAVVEDLLFSLNKEQGITVVIVTHDEDLAARCDRRIYLKDGEIVDEVSA